MRVVDLDGTGAEIRRVQQSRAVGIASNDRRLGGRNSEALVDSAGSLAGVGIGEIVPGLVDGYDALGAPAVRAGKLLARIDARIPPDDGPVLGREQEDRRGDRRLPVLV